MRYTQRTFTQTDVHLDNNEFDNCAFIRCKLIFSGGEFLFTNNARFDQIAWELRGPAHATLDFLRVLRANDLQAFQQLMDAKPSPQVIHPPGTQPS